MSARGKKSKDAPGSREIHVDELRSIVARTKELGLPDEEHAMLASAIDTLGFVTSALESKDVSIAKLRRYLFGAATESSASIIGRDSASAEMRRMLDNKVPAKGHGRIGASEYTGATRCSVAHATLAEKELCPACSRGKLYPISSPQSLVRVTGMAPLTATVYELAQLRCNTCGEVYTASLPEGVGEEKYDDGAVAMIALLKYGAGIPFHRIQNLQRGLGIPLPAATQWELVSGRSPDALPAYQELVRQAAQGGVIHTDDTTMKILDLVGERRRKAIEAGDIDPNQRAGLFTSGIVSIGGATGVGDGHAPEIVLFFTGHKHAGENLENVLRQRAEVLAPPIHMCDALSSNTAGDFDALLARCVAHGRRTFVEIYQNFPEECRRVLEDLRTVYRIDGRSRVAGLTADDRLALHQKESAPVMEALHAWMKDQLVKRQVEPNSSLGKAYAYMLRHWEGLTLFLREPGAPIDNNTCERALKKAVLNRKNAYFYRTQYGAEVGDLYMSLIHTAERCGTSPFDYLRALLENTADVAAAPSKWMPWNYAATLSARRSETQSVG